MIYRQIIFFFTVFVLTQEKSLAEKIYVVQRERGNLSVIENDEIQGEINDLGNLNHATIKVWKSKAYLITRDGYLIKIDPKNDKVLKKVKVGNSSIGIDFTDSNIMIANYDPKNVVILDDDLNVIHSFETSSRNVGIRAFGDKFVFSLMDKDEIWLVKGKDVKIYKDVGKMPFDAMLKENVYITCFFNSNEIGILDLKTENYKRITLSSGESGLILKIPHVGLWGVKQDIALIPGVGEKKIYVLDLNNFSIDRQIDVAGLPVFTIISPDKNYGIINFSGDMEDYISVIDLTNYKTLLTKNAGKRVMHMRFSKDSKKVYVSSFFDSKVRIFRFPEMEIIKGFTIPNPSGIFLID